MERPQSSRHRWKFLVLQPSLPKRKLLKFPFFFFFCSIQIKFSAWFPRSYSGIPCPLVYSLTFRLFNDNSPFFFIKPRASLFFSFCVALNPPTRVDMVSDLKRRRRKMRWHCIVRIDKTNVCKGVESSSNTKEENRPPGFRSASKNSATYKREFTKLHIFVFFGLHLLKY